MLIRRTKFCCRRIANNVAYFFGENNNDGNATLKTNSKFDL